MSSDLLNGLVIRTACVRRLGLGYICTGDPAKEAEGVPHAITFRYQDGAFGRGEANFDAFATTLISVPAPGLVSVSGAGDYSLVAPDGNRGGNLFDQGVPPARSPRIAGIRGIGTIAGQAHVVGLRGLVYRFEGHGRWARLDDGLPESFDGQAIDGHALDALVAVGRQGAIWRFDGTGWHADDTPTEATLTSVVCGPDGMAWAAGHGGALLACRDGAWQAIAHAMGDDIWDLAWFDGALYASTMRNVHVLRDGRLAPVDFGSDAPKSCYQLSTAKDAMWSVGEFEVMAFDGTAWRRIV